MNGFIWQHDRAFSQARISSILVRTNGVRDRGIFSEGLLGTAKENIMWMGYDDGMLEYAPQPKLTEEATAIIRRVRPNVLPSVDPGEWYERWHKTDRMAAFNTIDAVRAADSGCIFRTRGCSRAWSHTRFRKCTSSILRRKRQIISSTSRA